MMRPLLPFSLLAATALATPAAADITPVEVWQDLQAYMESVGYTVTGNETGGGDQFTVNDVVMVSTLPQDEGEVRFEIGTVTFTDDGAAVAVSFPATMPIRFDIETEPGSRAKGTVAYRHTALDMRVSGSVSAPRYDYTADTLALELTDLAVDGTPVGRDEIRLGLSMADVTGSSLSQIGGTRVIEQTFDAGSLGYEIFMTDVDGGDDKAQIVGSMMDLSMTAGSEMPASPSGQDGVADLIPDMTGDVSFVHRGGTLDVNSTTEGSETQYSARTEGADLNVDVTPSGLGYGVTSRGVTLQLVTPDMPVPLDIEATEAAFDLSGPMRPTETAQPFDLSFALRGFEMAEAVWSLFDPGAALPRDPALLEIDLSGEMRQLIDMFDEEAVAALDEEDRPTELQSMALDGLTLELAGARLTGTGGFTFDNSDFSTFDGIPAPSGEVTLELSGINALIDTLVTMGLVPQEQAMGVRMMMSMFAQPIGDDMLSSKIEVKGSGEVLANGQRLR